MILKLPENRKKIIEYLNNVDEDTFINEVVIPFFGSQGYQVYRINSHGPSEHGKDIIFCRYVPFFFENEFIAVQAKAEKVTKSNVTKFSDQLKRALKIKFAPRSGTGGLSPHYAIFINARTHTNDAYTEFPQLVDSPHAKILSQENVCELIIQSGIAPRHLIEQLSISTPETQSKEDKVIFDTILGNNPADIDNLLDHKLKFLKDEIAPRTKELIIDYIYDRWQMDRSWEGTVKPMKWFDTYFDFINEKQYKYFVDVLEELTSTTPSFEALPYTSSVARKMTTEILFSIIEPFTLYCAKMVLSGHKDHKNLILKKLQDLKASKKIANKNLKTMMRKILNFGKDNFDDLGFEAARKEIQAFAYPELAEFQKKRRKRIKPNQ